MRFLKFFFAVLFAFAMYKAYRHLILGIPVDPEKALTEWSKQANVGTPKKISETITLIGTSVGWHDPKGISNMYEEESKNWIETYEVSGRRDTSTLDQAKDKIIGNICQSSIHRKILAMAKIELLVRTAKKPVVVDQAAAFRLGLTPPQIYPLEMRIAVSKASCIGR